MEWFRVDSHLSFPPGDLNLIPCDQTGEYLSNSQMQHEKEALHSYQKQLCRENSIITQAYDLTD